MNTTPAPFALNRAEATQARRFQTLLMAERVERGADVLSEWARHESIMSIIDELEARVGIDRQTIAGGR